MATRRASLPKISMELLRKELQRRQGRIRGLLKKRSKLVSKIATLDAQIVVAGGRVTAHSNGTVPASAARKRPKNEMKLADAMVKAMGGKSMSVPELVEAVKKIGYRSNSPNLRSMVAQRLISEKALFKRVERGVYAVK